LVVSQEWVEQIRARMPELPDAKKGCFTADMGLSVYDTAVLTADRAVAEYFEAVVSAGGDPKRAANWITGELFRLMKEADLDIVAVSAQIPAKRLVELMGLVEKGTVNSNTAKEVLAVMLDSGQTAERIVEARGLAQVSDGAALVAVVNQVLDAHPDQVTQYLDGKESLSGWFMGQVMKATRGKANPQMARRMVTDQLEARRGSG
jgi:aspartyl-tRNA(Asn)/glutamyl-tRNA(Gln) amidotransferase subunit B